MGDGEASSGGQPLSPAARLFHSPRINCYIIAIMGCKTKINPDVVKAGLEQTLLKHPRFSSKLVISKPYPPLIILFLSSLSRFIFLYFIAQCPSLRSFFLFCGVYSKMFWGQFDSIPKLPQSNQQFDALQFEHCTWCATKTIAFKFLFFSFFFLIIFFVLLKKR